DYSVGFSVSEPFIHDVIGKWRYQRAEKIINKYGSVAIFFFNFLPISSPIIVLAAGFLRVDFKKVLFYSFIGLLAKYSLIVILFRFIF
ncbi:MAG: VTT domain-containing protein, partial [Nanoarchaeota archaeon]|nr:VTT domain-containing protein [Nanoarchaeota archaeon]